jgi:hypothetical protein
VIGRGKIADSLFTSPATVCYYNNL